MTKNVQAAIIQCEVCNHNVSAAARSCPGCGQPMDNCKACGSSDIKTKRITTIGGWVVAAVSIVGAILVAWPIGFFFLASMFMTGTKSKCRNCDVIQ